MMPTAAALINPAADKTEYLPPTEGRSIALHPELFANERNMLFRVCNNEDVIVGPVGSDHPFLNQRN